jgi:hypothetical protein
MKKNVEKDAFFQKDHIFITALEASPRINKTA